jgi:hypothetical protein
MLSLVGRVGADRRDAGDAGALRGRRGWALLVSSVRSNC